MTHLRIGILGATGMVGQRFVALLEGHPWFKVSCVAASPESAGKSYSDAVKGRWALNTPIPAGVANLSVMAVERDAEQIVKSVDAVFCALDLDKERIQSIELKYAASGIPVISNNSAHRWTEDVPMIMPEVNPEHCALVDFQRKNRGWGRGFIAVKPNCSIQSYVPVLTALQKFEPGNVVVTTLQAVSGAGKTLTSWPEMNDNVIPFIKGEEEKSVREPLKVWGRVGSNGLSVAEGPQISATCIRVPVSDGHMASVSVKFRQSPTREELVRAIMEYKNPIASMELPSAPREFMHIFEDDTRPQTKLDRDFERGMGVTVGRIAKDNVFDWRFVALSHNTIRGAAGGAILMAELLRKKGYI